MVGRVITAAITTQLTSKVLTLPRTKIDLPSLWSKRFLIIGLTKHSPAHLIKIALKAYHSSLQNAYQEECAQPAHHTDVLRPGRPGIWRLPMWRRIMQGFKAQARIHRNFSSRAYDCNGSSVQSVRADDRVSR